MSGELASVLIIAVCFAGLHTLVNLRQEQAKALGVPYMDRRRRLLLSGCLVLCVVYFGGLVIAVSLGW